MGETLAESALLGGEEDFLLPLYKGKSNALGHGGVGADAPRAWHQCQDGAAALTGSPRSPSPLLQEAFQCFKAASQVPWLIWGPSSSSPRADLVSPARVVCWSFSSGN